MKAYVLKKQNCAGWENIDEPKLLPYGAILKPIAVSPCTSDIHTIFGNGSPKKKNLVLGHECIAEVIAIGELVKDFKVGDKVAVPAITPNWRDLAIQDLNFRHASAPFSGHQLGRTMDGVFAERFAIPDADTTLSHIPDNITDEQALMSVDVMTTGFTGAEAANIKIGDTVCVMGIGPIGLMAIAGAKLLGAGRIIAIGSRPNRINLAMKYGATDIVDYKKDVVGIIKELTNNSGVDSTIIAGGDSSVVKQAYDITKYGIGTISNINYFGNCEFLEIPTFSGGKGMCGKTLNMELAKGGRARIERMLTMIQYNRVDPSPLVTHNLFGFDKIENAIDLMKNKPDSLIKVMVHF